MSFAKTCSIGLRQEQELGSGRPDCAAHGLAAVAAEIVHDDDLTRFKRRNEDLAHPGQEDLAIDGTIEEARRRRSRPAEALR